MKDLPVAHDSIVNLGISALREDFTCYSTNASHTPPALDN